MKSRNISDKIVVTGGGSGGHVSCADAIITELHERYNLSDSNFLYIGGDLGLSGEKYGNSLEIRYFKDADFNKQFIRSGKLQRVFSVRSIILLFRTFLGFVDSYKILKVFRPTIIISTGGYTTVPVCMAGKILGAKIYLHEQTSTVGLSNKIVSKFSEKVFLTYTTSQKYFDKRKCIHVGCPVRKSIFSHEGKGKYIQTVNEMILNKEKYPLIYISGGGLGSHTINTAIISDLEKFLNNFQIVLQTGDSQTYKDYDNALNAISKLPEELKKRFLPVKYVDEEWIGYLYNNINAYVGRAGANTVYEIGILRIPSVFIPIPWVTHNEQEENAKILVKVGLSEIVMESSLSFETLNEALVAVLAQGRKVDEEELNRTFRTDAVQKLIDNINIK